MLEPLEPRIAPATFIVSNTTDDADNPADGSLRSAIELANALPGSDTIKFDRGVFGKNDAPDAITLAAPIVISSDLQIQGTFADKVVIDGNDATRLFEVADGDPNNTLLVSLENMTLRNGNGFGTNYDPQTSGAQPTAFGPGGAILSTETLGVGNVVFEGNSSVSSGGAIYLSPTSVETPDGVVLLGSSGLLVTDSTFHGNEALVGGAISFDRAFGPLLVSKSTFSQNQADPTDGLGGAIFVSNPSIPLPFFSPSNTIEKSTFSENSAGDRGGAIYLNVSVDTNVDRSDFIDNIAGNRGGAIYAITSDGVSSGESASGADITVARSTFLGNQANNAEDIPAGVEGGRGGALFVELRGGTSEDPITLDINRSTFDGNSAIINGGAIRVVNSSLVTTIDSAPVVLPTFSEILIHNTDIINNSADEAAGGAIIANADPGGILVASITKSTIGGNSASSAGGLWLTDAVDSAGARFSIGKGSVISNNDADGALPGFGDFGGLALSGGVDLTLSKSTVRDNTSAANGAGIGAGVINAGTSSQEFTGLISLDRARILSNAADGQGGGIFQDGGMVSIERSKLMENTSQSEGGAIYAKDGASLQTDRSRLSGNSSGQTGGAIMLSNGVDYSDARSRFIDNMAAGPGGAIFAAGITDFRAEKTRFQSNHSNGSGGAVYLTSVTSNPVEFIQTKFIRNWVGSPDAINGTGGALSLMSVTAASIDNSKFLRNEAGDGGGLYADAVAALDATKTSWSRNGASTGDGGGIVLLNSSAATIEGGSIKSNSAADSGGGIYLDNTSTLDGSVKVTKNAAPTDPDISREV